jgi:DNA topoisomerase-1
MGTKTDDAPVIADPEQVAADAGLRYVSDQAPGIRRKKRGKGFSYETADGTVISDPEERARIASIAIPPAWTDVWICPATDGHILATGRDDRGRKQYRYHPRWREVRDADKFGQLAEFGRILPDVRKAVDADLRRRGLPREKVLGLVVKLLDETLIRIGNESYAAENESYGLTTLKSDHVEVMGNVLLFDFVGKSGLEHAVFIEDKQLARIVHQCHELGGQDLFAYHSEGDVVDVTSTDVNAYLSELAGPGVTAKTFRTWGGTTIAAATLALDRPSRSERQAEQAVLSAFDVAAEVLGNTRAVCRSCYVHPVVPESYREGRLQDVWKRSRSGGELDRSERAVLKLLTD